LNRMRPNHVAYRKGRNKQTHPEVDAFAEGAN